MERSSIDELVEQLAGEVDGTLVEENLRLTPTERVEKVRAALQFIEDGRDALRRARDGDGLSKADRDARR